MYDRREIYKHAPLALVTAEVQFPYSPRLRQEDTLDRIQLALEELLPVRRTEKRFTLQISAGKESQASSIDVQRFLDRPHRLSLVTSPEAFTVETTSYDEFDSFLTVVTKVSEVLIREKAIPAVERVGLRYIDEIRVPEAIESAAQWVDWVNPRLLPSIDNPPGPLKTSQGIALFDLGDSAQLQFQFAAVNGTPVVNNSPLRRLADFEPGPFFVLDLDSFWKAATPEKSTDFSIDFLRSTLSRLHAPMGQVFQSALTDRLRDVFRGVS
ncbi:TIGR04255 family protein [Streptomyces europaeiscabiei]|uniref:TIGR04255 family protein n=1 Tax=Streptomyces TaxID=1883 RepID=UPI0015C51375|nr:MULTISPECIES: TIGR04255 family protein [Streptomyces]MDX3631697.1 TIGR04255 family protein [Streptomyces europaeiscabiei]MDX3649478.1 TIGR04255 family protein [Streptomyces europaeiscabiei]WUD34446.1 TIGR04255 family protein [Streptomyces europaeiscabiei]